MSISPTAELHIPIVIRYEQGSTTGDTPLFFGFNCPAYDTNAAGSVTPAPMPVRINFAPRPGYRQQALTVGQKGPRRTLPTAMLPRRALTPSAPVTAGVRPIIHRSGSWKDRREARRDALVAQTAKRLVE